MVGGQPEISFASSFGVTPNLTDPHEFGYFWSYWLGSRDQIKSNKQVDWIGLSKELRLLAGEFGRPVVFKNLIAGCHVQGLAEALPKTVFVRISRNNVDNAISIARAREGYYHDRSRWWSLRSGYVDGMEKRHWTEQISRQLAGVMSMLDTSMETVSRFASTRTVEVDYASLCNDPKQFIDDVRSSVQALGCDVREMASPPALEAEVGLKDDDRSCIVRALEECGLSSHGGMA